jgi:hypothetical protein
LTIDARRAVPKHSLILPQKELITRREAAAWNTGYAGVMQAWQEAVPAFSTRES